MEQGANVIVYYCQLLFCACVRARAAAVDLLEFVIG